MDGIRRSHLTMAAPPNVTLFIDPVSQHFQRDALFDVDRARLNGDNILAPYVYLRDCLRSQGIQVYTADRLLLGEEYSERNVYISMGPLRHYRTLRRRR